MPKKRNAHYFLAISPRHTMMTSTRWLGVAWCIASVLGLAPASSFAQQISKLRSTSSHKADRVQMPNHLLHNPGDLTVAIFDDGSIGTDNLSFSGPGITWRGVQGLFVSGVIFGTSERAAVNGLMGDYRNPPANADTRGLQSNFAEGFTFDANFDQITEAVLNDEDAPLPYGVDIVQRSYSQTGDPFVFLRYGFINKGANTLDDFYAGIFADWDLGTVFTNGGGYALEEQLVYNFDAAEANGPHFGLVALDGLAGMMTTNNLGNLASPRTDGFANFSIPDGREHSSQGDYDNDGDLDLVVTNSTIDGSNPARNYLYRNDGGNSNHWLSLSLLGTRSNTSGIGATVRVRAVIYGETVEQLREISGSPTGDRAQNSQRAHVGLGDATIVESITITWPSGVVDSYENVSVNTFYHAIEGQDLRTGTVLPVNREAPSIPPPAFHIRVSRIHTKGRQARH